MTTTFSERTMHHLRNFMDAKNISQRELASAMGVTEARVSQIFREGSNITLKSVDEIEAGLLVVLNNRPLNNFIFIDLERGK
jgi:transcriptional regulator with XRE-family HTH domain